MKKHLPEIARIPEVRHLIQLALDEDVGDGDITTMALVPSTAKCRATILAKQACVVAGCDVAAAVFRAIDSRVRCFSQVPDGHAAHKGERVLLLEGPAAAVLTGERTALNFMQRLSGIATLTHEFVRRVERRKVTILDTRKTTPGLRALEKYAVLCGGGTNHRIGLYDAVLIKDNHRMLWQGGEKRSLAEAVKAARARWPKRTIEIEVENEAELLDALAGEPDWILLDNMSPYQLRRCVRLCRKRARLEASGGITMRNISAVAASGVDAISLGCLTHSAPSVDLSLEFTSLG